MFIIQRNNVRSTAATREEVKSQIKGLPPEGLRVFRTEDVDVSHEFLPKVPVRIGTQVFADAGYGRVIADCASVGAAEAALRLLRV